MLKILVVDDHELILNATIDLLKLHYPHAEVFTARTTQNALQQVEAVHPNLLILDPSLLETSGNPAEINAGIQSLKFLMKNYVTLNSTLLQSASTCAIADSLGKSLDVA